MELDNLSNEELAHALSQRDDLTEVELILLDRLLRAMAAMS